jgi:two-component system response regulator YesN
MEERCRVLVVEDEYIMRQGMKHLVDWESEGFDTVGFASNGKEAIEMIEAKKPHIVITDIVMPVMNGIELTKLLQIQYPKIKLIVLSGYNDFEYVKETFQHGAVDYILKPTLNPRELLVTLKKTAAQIPNLILAGSYGISAGKLITQVIAGFETPEILSNLRKLFPNSQFCMIGTDVAYNMDASRETIEKQREYLVQAAEDYLRDYIWETGVVNNRELLLLVNFKDNQFRILLNQLKKMVSGIEKIGCSPFFVYTPPFNSVDKIKAVYQETLSPFLEQRFYHKNESLLCTDQFEQTGGSGGFDAAAYRSMTGSMKLEEALKYLHDFIVKVIQRKAIQEFELKALTQNALYLVISALEELKFDKEHISSLKRKCFKKINDIKFAEDFLSEFGLILDEFRAIIKKYAITTDSLIINKMLEYIDEHYAEPLTLKKMAEAFSFNYFYLSSYFSENSGEGFNEYLNQIRIKKAEELLCRRDITVSEVGGMVGYTDHSYFCRVFKKLNGYTPSDYRKRMSLPQRMS